MSFKNFSKSSTCPMSNLKKKKKKTQEGNIRGQMFKEVKFNFSVSADVTETSIKT